MSAPEDDARPWVMIYRLQLFKRSETFITAQAEALRRARPLYVGWRRHGAPPPGARVVAPPGLPARLALHLLGDPGAVLAATGGTRPRVVHAHFGVDALFGLRLARRLKAPLVVTLHGFDVGRRRRALLASLRPALIAYALGRRRVSRGADLLLAVSPSIADAALRLGAPRERLLTHATGVDLARLRPGPGGDRGLIVHVGRLVEKKGADTLLAAVSILSGERPGLRLAIIGEGPLRRRLARQVEVLGLTGRVELLGGLGHEETLAWMARAAVVAVPSRAARDGDTEGLPTAMLEAAALGRPLLASDIPAISQAFSDGVEATLRPAGDPAALAEGLDLLLREPDRAARQAAAARSRVEARYDLARQTEALEELYAGLARRRG